MQIATQNGDLSVDIRRGRLSAPIVGEICRWAIVSDFVWSVHGHALQFSAESCGKHLAVRSMPTHVDSGYQLWQIAPSRQTFAGTQELLEILWCLLRGPHCSKLHVARIVARFRRRTTVTNRQTHQLTLFPASLSVIPFVVDT